MSELKKQIYLMKNEFFSMLSTEIILFLFGQLLFSISVYLMQDDETVFELGTVLALAAAFFVQLFSGFCTVAKNFSTTVIMGGTRRDFVWTNTLLTYAECLATMLIVYLFHLLEIWKFRMFYPKKVIEFDLSILLQWKYILAACFVILAFRMFTGALYLKVGQKVFWVIWGVWMVIALGGDRLSEQFERMIGQDGFVFLNQISADWLVLAGVILALPFFAAARAMLCRQQANFI